MHIPKIWNIIFKKSMFNRVIFSLHWERSSNIHCKSWDQLFLVPNTCPSYGIDQGTVFVLHNNWKSCVRARTKLSFGKIKISPTLFIQMLKNSSSKTKYFFGSPEKWEFFNLSLMKKSSQEVKSVCQKTIKKAHENKKL